MPAMGEKLNVWFSEVSADPVNVKLPTAVELIVMSQVSACPGARLLNRLNDKPNWLTEVRLGTVKVC